MSRLLSHTCAQPCPLRLLDLQDISTVTRHLSAGAIEAYAIDGKPADCTMLALHGPLFQAGNTLHLLKAVNICCRFEYAEDAQFHALVLTDMYIPVSEPAL